WRCGGTRGRLGARRSGSAAGGQSGTSRPQLAWGNGGWCGHALVSAWPYFSAIVPYQLWSGQATGPQVVVRGNVASRRGRWNAKEPAAPCWQPAGSSTGGDHEGVSTTLTPCVGAPLNRFRDIL